MGRTCKYNECLAVITGVFSASSLVCLCIGLSTHNWLYTAERMKDESVSPAVQNISYRNITIGLWRKCVEDPKKKPVVRVCTYIDYFSNVDRDELGPTDTIILSLRWVTLFPLGSLLILVLADIIAIVGHWTSTRVLNFLSGILSVVGEQRLPANWQCYVIVLATLLATPLATTLAMLYRFFARRRPVCLVVTSAVHSRVPGHLATQTAAAAAATSTYPPFSKLDSRRFSRKCLVTLVGIVVYVSAVTGEAADNKPKPTSMDGPTFLYEYGPSFFIAVTSFVGAEVTGVLSVHVYIHRYKQAYHRQRDPNLTTSVTAELVGGLDGGGGGGNNNSVGHWSNGHRPIGVRSGGAATAGGGSPGAASMRTPGGGVNAAGGGGGGGASGSVAAFQLGCGDEDGSEDTYTPLSESCYAGGGAHIGGVGSCGAMDSVAWKGWKR